MTAPEQDSHVVSGFWTFPGSQDLGYALTLIGAGMALYGIGTVGYASVMIPAACIIIGLMVLERGVSLWLKGSRAAALGEYPEMPPQVVPQHFISGGATNPDVARVLEVVRATWEDALVPVWDKWELEDDALVSYCFKAVEAGFFDKNTRTRFSNKMTEAVPPQKGAWKVTFDNKSDTVTVTAKSGIPNLALPPLWKVAGNMDEARTAYKKWEMTLGPGEGGEMVTFKPQVFPHVAVIATSGGGKSVFLRACIEQMRAVGGQILLGDGKGSDYATYRGQNNVIAIGRGSGSKGVEYIAAIELAFRIMQQRQNTAAERKAADPEGWEDVPPVFLVLDELKSVLKKWSTELDGKSYKAIESKVNQILALGRQLRVHTYVASQDVYSASIPGSWLTNIGMKISLGKPHKMTIEKGFDISIQEEAWQISSGIDPNTRGRGMIAGVDEDSGQASVKSYQGFLGYSPGEATPDFLNAQQREQWNAFRQNVSEAIPHLYSRKWFKIDEPSEAQLEQEKKTGRDFGYIDFELFSVDEIAAMQIINLDMRDENGNIVPNPEMIKYDPDPSNEFYVCRPILSESNSITDI